jgi:hypothetical protein
MIGTHKNIAIYRARVCLGSLSIYTHTMFAVSKPLRVDIKKNFNFLILYQIVHLNKF